MNERNSKIEEGGVLSNKPEDVIREIWQETSVMGANDAESSLFQDILCKLKNREITNEEAIKQAQEILDRKEVYH